MIDVPPRICGIYDELASRASTVDIAGVPVTVCHPAQVLGRLRGRIRPKDVQRAAIYQQMDDPAHTWQPTGIARLLQRLH